MSAAEDAYEAARAEIARVKAAEDPRLDFENDRYRALDRLPEEIGKLSSVRVLNLARTQVTDLTPVRRLNGVRWLSIQKTPVRDLYPVSGLSLLEWLSMNQSLVSDLRPLDSLFSLSRIFLNSTKISNISPLSNLKNLQRIYANGTGVSTLDSLSNLKKLQILFIDSTKVETLSPIRSLDKLEGLSFNQTGISDLTPISILPKLRSLYFSDSLVPDLRPLLHLSELRDISRSSTKDSGIFYKNCAATRRDDALRKLSEITDIRERTMKTLDYIQTLPPWPKPLAKSIYRTTEEVDSNDFPRSEEVKPAPVLTVEEIVEAQDLAGWRFSPVHSAMELFVRDTPLAAHQEQLARMAAQRLAKLLSSLGNRTNAGGLRQEVYEEASRFKDLLEDSSRPLSARSLELWGSLIALGDLLDANELSRKDGRDPLDLLATESRAALQTFLGIAANLVRSFPEARALDEDYGGFSRRQVTREMILTLIEDALRTNMVNPDSAALIQHVAEVGDHVGPQADKAFSVSVKGTGNLILAAALAVPLYFGGTIADGILTDIGTDISDHYKLGERAIEFLENSGLNIEEFLDSLAPDEKARLKSAVEDARRQAAERGRRGPR